MVDFNEEMMGWQWYQLDHIQTRMWPMPNVMVALSNIGGALCSMTQSMADAHYLTAMQ